jgi:hypothetical protein
MALDKTRFAKIVALSATIGPGIKKELLLIRTMGIMAGQTALVRQWGMLSCSAIRRFFVAQEAKLIALGL